MSPPCSTSASKGAANLKSQFSFGTTPREAQEAAALTAGMISMIDDAVGSVIGALDAAGLSDDTVVSFNADHGEHLGDHKLMLKGSEQYQQILRVPFVWRDTPDRRVKAMPVAGAAMPSARRSTCRRPSSTAQRSRPMSGCRAAA